MTEHSATRSMFDPALVRPAIVDSFKKLTPRTQFRNPVMFCVYVGSILTTILWVAALVGQAEAPAGFILAVSLWLSDHRVEAALFGLLSAGPAIVVTDRAFPGVARAAPSAGRRRCPRP